MTLPSLHTAALRRPSPQSASNTRHVPSCSCFGSIVKTCRFLSSAIVMIICFYYIYILLSKRIEKKMTTAHKTPLWPYRKGAFLVRVNFRTPTLIHTRVKHNSNESFILGCRHTQPFPLPGQTDIISVIIVYILSHHSLNSILRDIFVFFGTKISLPCWFRLVRVGCCSGIG